MRVWPVLLACSAACSSFGSDPGVDPVGGPDAGTTDGAVGSVEGGSPEDPSPSCAVAAPTIDLAKPTAALALTTGYPWGITTDDTLIFWIEQPVDASNTDDEAKNGHANATVHWRSRAAKDTTRTTTDSQKGATTIARAGDKIYWAVETDDATGNATGEIRSAPVGCEKCKVEVIGSISGHAHSLTRVSDTELVGVLDLATEGPFFSVVLSDPAMPPVVKPFTQPSVALGTSAGLVRAPAGSYWFATETMPPTLGFQPPGATTAAHTIMLTPGDGSRVLATDCDTVYVARYPLAGNEIHFDVVPANLAGSAVNHAAVVSTPATPAMPRRIYDMAIDQKYLYIASPDLPGLVAVDRSSYAATALSPTGGVWRVATDAQGVYFAPHVPAGGLFFVPKN